MKFLLTILLVPTAVLAKPLQVTAGSYNFETAAEYQAILSQLKQHGEFTQKTKDETPVPSVTPTPEMSQGQKAVEEAKAKNRALIAEQNAQEKAQTESATSTKDEAMSDLQKWKLEEKRTREGWKKEVSDQLKQWRKEQDAFLGRIKVYQQNTFELPVKTEKIVERKITTHNLPDVHIVNGAFNIPIKDQRNRATCSAFAGARALEIVLAQNNVNEDLSEQYLYWASKPDCQTSPCQQKGSWVTHALKYSQSQMNADIPGEGACAYRSENDNGNETHIPLGSGCRQGVIKVEGYEEVKALADVVEKLKAHTPVIMGAKLTENFYINKGLVTLEESTKSYGKMLDGHSLGHAFLAVGLMELPQKLQATEGTYCIVVANSWGKGWGAGGYSCLTENWLTKFRQKSPFVAVTRINTKS